MKAHIPLCIRHFAGRVIVRSYATILFTLVVLLAVAPSPCARADFLEADNAIYKCTISYDVFYNYDDPRHPVPGVVDVCTRKRFRIHCYVVLDQANSRYSIFHLDRRNKRYALVAECPLSCMEDFECRRDNRWEAIFGHFETANGTMDFDNDGDTDGSRSEQFCLRGRIRQNMRLRESGVDDQDFITSARGWFQRMTCYDDTVYIESAIGAKNWSFTGPFGATDTGASSGIACVRARISWRFNRAFTDRWHAGPALTLPVGEAVIDSYLFDRGWLHTGSDDICDPLDVQVNDPGALEPWLP